jgi:hypothetical protein
LLEGRFGISLDELLTVHHSSDASGVEPNYSHRYYHLLGELLGSRQFQLLDAVRAQQGMEHKLRAFCALERTGGVGSVAQRDSSTGFERLHAVLRMRASENPSSTHSGE